VATTSTIEAKGRTTNDDAHRKVGVVSSSRNQKRQIAIGAVNGS
jgi:hypothetical protein